MSVNSKAKGKRYELELVGRLKAAGWNAHRSQQYCGANGDADVEGLPGFHIEAKRREQISIYDWYSQAKSDCKAGLKPIVVFRKQRCDSMVCISLDDFLEVVKPWALEYLEGVESNGTSDGPALL